MCGRYFFELENHSAFDKLRQKINQFALFEYASDEIFPTNQVLIMKPGDKDYTLDTMKWGIAGFDSKALINARSEGIEQKKTFTPMLQNRCLIPCNGFYEWIKAGKQKQKVYIQRDDTPLFYLAGIYNAQKEFVIVTGESLNEMKKIHHRTPIIITEEQIPLYLKNQMEFEVNNAHLSFQKLGDVKQTHEQINLFAEDEGAL